MRNKKIIFLGIILGAVFFFGAGLSSFAQAAVSGTSTPMTSPWPQNKIPDNREIGVLKLELSATGSETLASTSITVATSANATPTAVTSASFDWIGLIKDNNGDGQPGPGDIPLATTTVSIGVATTVNVPPGNAATGTFFVVLRTSNSWTDNGVPTTSGAVAQSVTISIAPNGVVVSPTSSSPIINTTTTQPFLADTHSQQPDATKVSAQYQSGTYRIFDTNNDGGVGELGILNIYSTSTAGAAAIATSTVSANGNTLVNLGSAYLPSVWLDLNDAAGNATSSKVQYNLPALPTVTSVTAFTDRIIINFSEQIDGMMAMNCANYIIDGSSLTCGGMGLPFVDVQGNKSTIKGLNLPSPGTISFSIPVNNTIKDINGANSPVTTYSNASLSVGTLVLPSITSLSVTSGAVGGSLTITGTNFGTGTAGDADHKVFFSGGFSQTTGPLPPIEVASYTSWSDTSIVVLVPAGAQGGPVNVMVGGVMSDMGPNSFFDISANYVAKIYYDSTNTLMPNGDKDNIRIVIGGMRGPGIHYDGDGVTTYNTTDNKFTITGVSSMGWTWAYDITGAHLNSQGQQVDTSAPQNHILTTTSKKISGTITLGTSCADSGKNKDVVIFAMPDAVDYGSTDFKPMDPAFFKTNTNCTVDYSVGIPTNGIYRVEAHIPPDPNATTSGSSAFTGPDALSVTVNNDTPAGKNFTFTAATHRIVGTVVKPSGSFGSDERGMLWVFAYQPRENGKGTGTQVANDGTFTLYVTKGTWKVGVGGENMSFPVEVQVDVDDTYLIASPAKGPTIIIAPPSDFIEGYVKDSAGNGLANVSLYAWLEGGPGGGNAQTDSQGYYKMYVTPGSKYHVGANSQSYGFLGEQSGITVSSLAHPTVNFTVSSSDNFTISGTVTKGGSPLQQAFVFITNGQYGQMLGSGGTDATGAYTVRVSGGSNRWLHVGLPAKGEIYLENLGNISTSTSKNIAIISSTIKVRISPSSAFTRAFVGVYSDQGGGFSNTDAAATGSIYREYQIDVQRPASGTTTYYVDGGIPGYGPLPQTSVAVNNSGEPVIVEITLGGLYTVSGTVSGANALDAWVSASGPDGGGGSAVNASGTYSIQLRDGIYDIGVGKPGYIGNKITTIVNGTTTPSQNLILTTATSTITGKVYLPGGVTTATNAWVWAEDGIGGWAGGSTDASGNYTLSVSPGSWTVKAAYDGYNSTGILVTAPAPGKNITLITVSGFAPNTKNAPITPSDGGIVSGTGIKVDFPKNALGTGSSAGTVEVKSTTNVVSKNDRQMVGTAKEITARDSSKQTITTLSGSITIELTASKAELVAANLTFAQAQNTKITYFDSTGGSWVEIPTVAILSVPSAATIAELNDDPAITFTGTTNHLSTYALSNATDSDAPPTPTNFSIAAGDGSAVLSWTASAGAAKYDIYKKSGDDYLYSAQTTAVSYTAANLTNGVTYYFKVSALDNSTPVKESAATAEVSATPVAAPSGGGGGGGDITSPLISNIRAEVGDIQTKISWATNEGSISWLVYGTTTAYGLEIKTTTSTLSHSLNLTGLSASTTYHYQVKSKDSAGNIGTYTDQTFTTLALGEKPKVEEVKKPIPEKAKKPISEMTTAELRVEILEIQQLIIKVLIQLITELQVKIAGLR